jgi:hypothetical protein
VRDAVEIFAVSRGTSLSTIRRAVSRYIVLILRSSSTRFRKLQAQAL